MTITTAPVKAPKPLRSGFCGRGMPDWSHARCTGHVGNHPCPCQCHREVAVTTTTLTPNDITTPGVYDMPSDVYHADPVPAGSLSASGARLLLPPSCPAKFHHERQYGRPPRRVFDFGHAAHKQVLGIGEDIEIIEAPDRRTKAVQQQEREARERGAVPLLEDEYAQVQEMAKAIREHPPAAKLLDPDRGAAEQSLFWRDQRTDIWRRARLDFLPNPGTGRMLLADYKTTKCADPEALRKTINDYGYHQQADWYTDAVYELGLAESAVMLFIFQEKTPPYLVTVAEPDTNALRIGRMFNRRAIDLYKQCAETGHWPSYSDGVELIPLPPYIENRYIEETLI